MAEIQHSEFCTWLLGQVYQALVEVEQGDAPFPTYERLVTAMEGYIKEQEEKEEETHTGWRMTREAWDPHNTGNPCISVDIPSMYNGADLQRFGLGTFVRLGDRFVYDPYITMKRGDSSIYDGEIDDALCNMFRTVGGSYATITWDDVNHPITGRVLREDCDESPVVHLDGVPIAGVEDIGDTCGGGVYCHREHMRPIMPWEERLDTRHWELAQGKVNGEFASAGTHILTEACKILHEDKVLANDSGGKLGVEGDNTAFLSITDVEKSPEMLPDLTAKVGNSDTTKE